MQTMRLSQVVAQVFVACSLAVYRGHVLIARYAVFNPDSSLIYLRNIALPMLKSTICLTERHVAPALKSNLHMELSYVIYTDSKTHNAVIDVMSQTFPGVYGRVQLVNLDMDPADSLRMQPILPLDLDPINFASVRRTLADTMYLPATKCRLLLGLDISFLREPSLLITRIASLKEGQALYMADSFWAVDADQKDVYIPYILRDYLGPQCPGVLGDFVYLHAGVSISTQLLQEKVRWYAEQPRVPWRTYPQAPHLGDFHGIDQFALSLALGEAVVPPGEAGCFILGNAYLHRGGVTRPPVSDVEAIHDKVISSCTALCYDTCSSTPIPSSREDYLRPDMNVSCVQSKLPSPSTVAKRCSTFDVVEMQSEQQQELSMLINTMCVMERYLWQYCKDGSQNMPFYVVFTNNRLCGQISMMLTHEFFDAAKRVRVINLDVEPIVLSTYGIYLSGCTDARSFTDSILVLDVSFAKIPSRDDVAWIDTLQALTAVFNASYGATLSMMDVLHLQPQADALHIHVQFCLCGDIDRSRCPSKLHGEFRLASVDLRGPV